MARLRRFWKAYLRLAAGLAGLIGAIILTLQFLLLLPFFAWHAQRAARKEAPGWTPIAPDRNRTPVPLVPVTFALSYSSSPRSQPKAASRSEQNSSKCSCRPTTSTPACCR